MSRTHKAQPEPAGLSTERSAPEVESTAAGPQLAAPEEALTSSAGGSFGTMMALQMAGGNAAVVQLDRSDDDTRRDDDHQRADDVVGGGTHREGAGNDLPTVLDWLANDWAGRAILERYLTGGGDWTIDNDARWAEYMMASPQLSTIAFCQLLDATTAAARGAQDGDQIVIDMSFPASVENGESIVGYEYLHGTNADVGGFELQATGTITEYGGVVHHAELTLNCRWNDIIDPNDGYATDTFKNRIAEFVTLGHATPYTIRIGWTTRCNVVRMLGDRPVTRLHGWPNDDMNFAIGDIEYPEGVTGPNAGGETEDAGADETDG